MKWKLDFQGRAIEDPSLRKWLQVGLFKLTIAVFAEGIRSDTGPLKESALRTVAMRGNDANHRNVLRKDPAQLLSLVFGTMWGTHNFCSS